MDSIIPIQQIDRSDKTFQFRVATSEANIADLERIIRNKTAEIDKILVRPKGDGLYQIIDGFQRTEAYYRVYGDEAKVPAKVLNIDEKTAAVRAAEANQKHGLKLTKEDRANIIKQLLLRFPEYTNRRIAKICNVTEGTIRNHRTKYDGAQSEEREGLDGKTRKLPKTKKERKDDPSDEDNAAEAPTDITPNQPATSEKSPSTENGKATKVSGDSIEQEDGHETTSSHQQATAPFVWHDFTLAETGGAMRNLAEDLELYADMLETFAQKEKLAPDEKVIRDSILSWAEQALPLNGFVEE